MTEDREVITRRDFIRGMTSAALAAAVGLPVIGCEGASESPPAEAPQGAPTARESSARVVLVRDARAVSGRGQLNAEAIEQMLDRAVASLLDEEEPEEAWKQLVTPNDSVGIKTNYWNLLPTPKELEAAIKRRVLGAGVSESSIRIDDRGARRTLADCTALINVRPLRSHHWAGIGGCMKNYIMFVRRASSYHSDSCADLGAIWQLPIVRGKTRLNVLAVLTPQFYGRGPHHFDRRYVWSYGGLMVSLDPVAVDAVGAHLLRTKRRQYFGQDRPITPTKHVAVADAIYGRGVSDLNKIELIKLGWMEVVLI
ncbi:MAG: DUF362 domain-containing protein [Armatimonadota bacterium]|nr:MAG: DUF362 domain-containing protein [Armatimonadota bacterium]